SVSMLTEGWDANNVTHIMGLRAFGSQLLCEQVAGRALRRIRYDLQGYDKDDNPTNDKRIIVTYKFPAEYAQIIGIPFNLFKQGTTVIPNPVETTGIFAIPDRQKDYEITFPILNGYRKEYTDDTISYDFSNLEPYEVDVTKDPVRTTMGSAFSKDERELQEKSVHEMRDQEIIYKITKELLRLHFSDDDQNLNFSLFNQLKDVVKAWYNQCVLLVGDNNPIYKRLIDYDNPQVVTDHIVRGINTQKNSTDYIRPIFSRPAEKFGSTKYVNGRTSREVYYTTKSHVNAVVADSDWERIAAKEMENIDEIISYVKNDYLGFSIPYVKDGMEKNYFPDFIARCLTPTGGIINLIIEITGFNKDKAEKKWFVENRWLPAVNAVQEKYDFDEWHFLEIANDIRNARQLLMEKIQSIQ
ncbi:MAG TPA: hypothetical protein VE912_02295, partial [Bacteroidales bacterium]|nr:hypothetical protein [Bacteroidales bacterium]